MATNDENPFQSPETVDDNATTGEFTIGELVVLMVLFFVVPPGIFVGLVLVAQFLTAGLSQ